MMHTLSPLEEAELLASCRGGDERAWARLYTLTAPKVRVFLRRNVGQRADLDDLCQQVFVELFSTIGRFRGDARVSTWLYRLSAHVAAKAWRSAGRHTRKLSALADSRTATPMTADSPSDTYQAQRLVEAVDDILGGLKPALRAVWILSAVEGLSPPEIADVIETGVGTARSRLTKARRLVLDGLSRRGLSPTGTTTSAGTTETLDPFAWTTTEEEASS